MPRTAQNSKKFCVSLLCHLLINPEARNVLGRGLSNFFYLLAPWKDRLRRGLDNVHHVQLERFSNLKERHPHIFQFQISIDVCVVGMLITSDMFGVPVSRDAISLNKHPIFPAWRPQHLLRIAPLLRRFLGLYRQRRLKKKHIRSYIMITSIHKGRMGQVLRCCCKFSSRHVIRKCT